MNSVRDCFVPNLCIDFVYISRTLFAILLIIYLFTNRNELKWQNKNVRKRKEKKISINIIDAKMTNR